jgi:fructan beta-fructosidase
MMPSMRFQGTFSVPYNLTLRTTAEGVRMFANPVKELEKLRKKSWSAANQELDGDASFNQEVAGELFDITAIFELGDARKVGLDIGGNRIEYDVQQQRLLDFGPCPPKDGKLTLRVLLDRPMLEVNANHGATTVTTYREKRGQVESIEAFAEGGNARLLTLEVNELESIWKE